MSLVPVLPVVAGYQLKNLIGLGADALVYRAERDVDGLRVALKVGRTPAAAVRLDAEAGHLRAVGDAFAPRCEGRGQTNEGLPWLAMELLEGTTLADAMVARTQRWSPDEAVALLEALAQAVGALERAGLVHRDLKPENVFLLSGGGLRLLDFGVACAPGTVGEGVMGSLEYLSPEQVNNEPVSFATDVYALGVITYELLSLTVPFVGSEHELAYGHLALRPPGLRTSVGNHPIEAVVLGALAKSPRRRPAGALAFLSQLKASLAATPGAAPGVAPAAVAAPAADKAASEVSAAFVFVESTQPFPSLERIAQQRAVTTAKTQGQRHVFAALPGGEILPLFAAIGLARQLSQLPGTRCSVDIGPMKVKTRRGGRVALSSSLLDDDSRFPAASATDVLVSRLVVDEAPDLRVQSADGDWFALAPNERTHIVDSTRPGLSASGAFGRLDLLRELAGEVRGVLGSRTTFMATVLGGPGLGRSTVLKALMSDLGAACHSVLVRCASDPGAAEAALNEVLAYWLGLDELTWEGAERALRDRLGHAEPIEVVALGAVMGWLPADDARIESLRAAPGVLRRTVARLLGEAIAQAAVKQGLVLLVDDVQAADELVLEALEQALVADVPLAVIATALPAFLAGRPTWGERAKSQVRRELPPLQTEAAHSMFRELLRPAGNVPVSMLDRLHARCEGVPRQMVELVRGLRAQGFVAKDAGGEWFADVQVLDRLPDSPVMQWLARQQLERLPEGLRHHARIAAVLGREVDPTELEAVISAMPDVDRASISFDSDAAVSRLASRGLLGLRTDGAAYFRQEAVQQALVGELGEAAQRVHRAALDWLLSQPAPSLTRVAQNAAAVGDAQLAARSWLEHAAHEQARHRYLDAERAYSHALQLLGDADGLSRLVAHQNRGIMRYRLNRFDLSVEDFSQSKALARQRSPLALGAILLDEAMAADWNREFGRAEKLTLEAVPLVKGDRLLETRLEDALARTALRANELERAVPLFRGAAQRARELGDAAYEVEITTNLLMGFVLPMQGQPAEAEACLNRVDEMTRAKGDELHRLAMLGNRSCLWIALDDESKFDADTRAAVDIAHRLGNFVVERNAWINAAYYRYWRAEFAAAEEAARQAVGFDERRFRGGKGEAQALLGRIVWARGASDEARRITRECAARHERAVAEKDEERTLSPNDVLLVDVMKAVLADGVLGRWDEFKTRAAKDAAGQELLEILEMMAIDAERRGEVARAVEALTDALAACARIPNVMEARLRRRLDQLRTKVS